MKDELGLIAESIVRGENHVTPRVISDLLSLILQAPEKTEVTCHPLGFIRVRIVSTVQSTLRMHIWPATERRPQVPIWNIHDHIFDIKSFIICGSVTNNQFAVMKAVAQPTHRLYQVSYSQTQSYLHGTKDLISCMLIDSSTYSAMTTYSVPRGNFHSSVVPEGRLAATLVVTSNHSPSQPKVAGDLAGDELYIYERHLCPPKEISALLAHVQSELKASLEKQF